MTIITDSSFLYALYNSRDSHHSDAMQFASQYTGGTVIPEVTLPEVTYLFRRDLGYFGVQQFLQSLVDVKPPLESIVQEDIVRVNEIAQQYPTAEFDFVDCCIMALSERLKITEIATFDRRDFSIFRPGHCDYFTLLP